MTSAGHSILMDPHSSHVEIGGKLAAYRAGLADAGHAFEGRTTADIQVELPATWYPQPMCPKFRPANFAP